jgi:predicted nucleic-acid-binding Zn-ribbon protein
LHTKNRGKSQQIIEANVKSIQNEQQQSTKLFDLQSSNNFLIFKCYYCSYQTNIEREYERHVVMKHPGKLAYPSDMDLERKGLN